MELFDIVDEQGIPTGEIVSRARAHEEGLRHRTAQIWVARRHEGKPQLLLQKRLAAKESYPNCYDTSSAGHISAGDEPLESALRELKEELGIRAEESDLEFLGTHSIFYEETFHGKLFKDWEVGFVFVYSKPVEISDMTLQPDEVDSVAWFDLEEVVAMVESGASGCCVPPSGLRLVRNWWEDKTVSKLIKDKCNA